ncbi:Fe-S cluster assembly protein SufD [Alkalilimnicola sp. S0819]|uniref:Fe-S cluster assembly protein SufD n=1 Tax=Alkalilimnicola sp. S0819 TaxID=2613922 RepID=UPI001261CAD9|nr:Fe-S cluster assembly protein SufD [Alkalilimnicola sp. S0819]KAB7623633.1 Fe-S cluster assembly protein SufD [Alkalilimnicola sp. S0819]MPQ16757.1 Fe-S cluster assembly protein SufD [Alkalilimnicola sp. S0819]
MQAAVVEHKSLFIQGFEAPGPHWLKERRRAAIAAFEQQGYPDKRREAWRNFNAQPLIDRGFQPASAEGGADAALAAAAQLGDCHRLVFVNGRFQAAASDVGELPEGVRLGSLAANWEAHELEADLAARGVEHEHPFAALNTAFFTDGAWLRVAANVQLGKPVLLQFITSEAGATAFPRVLVQAEQGAELTVIEQHLDGGADSLSCPVSELVAADNARIEYYRLQEEGAAADQMAVLTADIARDARVSVQSLSSGAHRARADLYARLNGEGGHAELNGLYLLSDGQFSDFHSWMEHRKPHCTSAQMFKGVLDGKSESVFDGLVKVSEGAVKTDAAQQNRNLLLTRRALAHSNPRLEIYNDDVKCSHGSTTGELDTEALFYMRARGIAAEDARALLIYAFAAELLEAIRLEPLRRYALSLLRRKLPGDVLGEEMP